MHKEPNNIKIPLAVNYIMNSYIIRVQKLFVEWMNQRIITKDTHPQDLAAEFWCQGRESVPTHSSLKTDEEAHKENPKHIGKCKQGFSLK